MGNRDLYAVRVFRWLSHRTIAALAMGVLVLGLAAPGLVLAHTGSGDRIAGAHVVGPVAGAAVRGQVALVVSGEGIPHPIEAQYSVDGGPFVAMAWDRDGRVYRAQVDTTVIEEGWHALKVRVTDRDGLSASSEVSVRVDNRPPSITIVRPADGTVWEGPVHLQVGATDGGGLASVAFAIDGGGFRALMFDEASGLYESSLDDAALSPGNRVIRARAIDEAGNSMEAQVNVLVDGVRVLEPGHGAILDGPAQVRVLAGDHDGIASVEFAIDGGAFQPMELHAASGLFHGILDASVLEAGSHDVTARVTDRLGRSLQSRGPVVLVDHAPPAVTILSPNSERVSDGIQLQVRAADDLGILRVDWRTDTNSGTMDFIPGSGLYEFNFDTRAEPNGFRLIYFNAIDLSGKSTEESIEVLINNTSP